MVATVDTVIHDAESLRALMDKYKKELTAGGYDEARMAAFDSALKEALSRESHQKTAIATFQQRTQALDIAVQNVGATIQRIQNAAKAAFGRDRVLLKEFRVGQDTPHSVKEWITWMDFFNGLCLKYSAAMTANGLNAEAQGAVATTYADLLAADVTQQNARKLQKAATRARNESITKLREEIFKLRKFVKACFVGDAVKLEEFSSVVRRHGTGKPSTVTAPAAEPSPAPSQAAVPSGR